MPARGRRRRPTARLSVNSALRRARAYLHKHLPEASRQSTLAELGGAGQRELVSRSVKATETDDLDGILALLTEDATWSMPPPASWFEGHKANFGIPHGFGLPPQIVG